MWKVPVELTRLAGWYLLIYDALATGLLAWTSMTYAYKGCANPEGKFLWGREGDHLLFPGNREGPAAFSSGVNHGISYGGGRALIPANSIWTAFYGGTSAPWGVQPNNPGVATFRVINEATGEVHEGSPPTPDASGRLRSMALAQAQQAGGADHTIRWEVTNEGPGFCIVDGSLVYVQIEPFPSIFPDP
jgi:hypothetical protein